MSVKKISLPLFILLLLSILGVAFQKPNRPLPMPPGDISSKWAKVDSLIEYGQPKTALELVEQIHQEALQSRNQAELYRTLLYKAQLPNQWEVRDLEQAWSLYQTEIERAEFPLKNLLQFSLAKILQSHFQNQRHVILSRSQIAGQRPDDIREWSARDYEQTIEELLLQSASPADKLLKIPASQWKSVLSIADSSFVFQPTLYDILGRAVVAHFRQGNAQVSRPDFAFVFSDSSLFLTGKNFLNRFPHSAHPQSPYEHIHNILHGLSAHHAEKNPLALMDLELLRLGFILEHFKGEKKDELYLEALSHLENSAKNALDRSLAISARANKLLSLGYQFNPRQNPEHKNRMTEALSAAEAVLELKEAHPYARNLARYVKTSVLSKNLTLTTEFSNYPGKAVKAMVTFRNVPKMWLRIAKFDNLPEGMHHEERLHALLKDGKVITEQAIAFKDFEDHNSHQAEISLGVLGAGLYVAWASESPDFNPDFSIVNGAWFQVSAMALLSNDSREDKIEFYALDAWNGSPVSGAKATLFELVYDYNKRQQIKKLITTLTSDKNGFFSYPKRKTGYSSFLVELKKGNDRCFPRESFYPYRYDRSAPQPMVRDFIFTDRAVYRPGQTVFYKIISLTLDGKGNYSLNEKRNLKVEIFDANGRRLDAAEHKTGDYASCHGSFTLPFGLLTGQFRLGTKDGSVNIQVEEYKRPTFEVTFQPVQTQIIAGKQVIATLAAKAYTGASLPEAEVKWRVVRQVRFPFYRWFYQDFGRPSAQETLIAAGQGFSDEKGEFIIHFEALPDHAATRFWNPAFTYRIEADVTDVNGEIQTGKTTVTAGYTGYSIRSNLPAVLEKETWKNTSIQAVNFNENAVVAKLTLEVFRLKEPETPIRKRTWSRPDVFLISKAEHQKLFPNDDYDDDLNPAFWPRQKQVLSKTWETANVEASIDLENLPRWDEGTYWFEVKGKDDFGNEIVWNQAVVIQSKTGKKNPSNSLFHAHFDKSVAEPGESVSFSVAAAGQARVWFERENKGASAVSGWLELNKSRETIAFSTSEADRGGFAIHYAAVIMGRFFSGTETIVVPFSNKKLDLALETWRDITEPGSEETWKIRIKGPSGDKAAAEMLATLYDASLDAFKPLNWNFSLFSQNRIQFRPLSAGSIGAAAEQLSFDYKRDSRNYPPDPPGENELNFFGLLYNYGYYPRTGLRNYPMTLNTMVLAEEGLPSKRTQKAKGEAMADAASAPDADEQFLETGQEETPETPFIRSDLRELAFFFPNLQTDAEGRITMTFTMPETITRWKLMALAHNNQLQTGELSANIITRKQLMVTPNAPRFIRQGDELWISARITNLSEGLLAGQAGIEILDAGTLAPLTQSLLASGQVQPFSIPKEGTGPVGWLIKIPATNAPDALIFRFSATSGNLTDGEEHFIPILTNRMMVTATLPVSMLGKSRRQWTFLDMQKALESKTAVPYRLTWEYTQTPAWLAVQALPYLMEFPHECMEQIFSRIYANSLGHHIVSSSPVIENVFKQWQTGADGNEKALVSALEKNEELKSLILEETPWVRQAAEDSKRKRMVAGLFDKNRVSSGLQKDIRKLLQGQSASGAWPWFPGMMENQYITQLIVAGFGKLKVMGVSLPEDVMPAIQKAVTWMDREAHRIYNEIQARKEKEEIPRLYMLQYLYARSFFKDFGFMEKSHKEAHDYFLNNLEKHWLKLDLNGKAMAATVFKRLNKEEKAAHVIRNLRETSTTAEDLGMFWKDNKSGFYWHQAPVETQAVLIEAFALNNAPATELDQMRLWLLKQKQVQDWKTTRATTDAVYALLMQGSNWLSVGSQDKVIIGSKTLTPSTMPDLMAEAGTGYYKTSWQGEAILPEMSRISIERQQEGPSWGAVYFQYFEEMDKVTAHGQKSPLSLTREIFRETWEKGGKKLVPVSQNQPLKVGDKLIVRLVLRTDRQMEFVHLKDLRGSGLEPEVELSGYRWKHSLGYYQSIRDAATHFFFDYLPTGTHVFEYRLSVTRAGNFSNGIASVQCMYAPEFASNAQGIRVVVE